VGVLKNQLAKTNYCQGLNIKCGPDTNILPVIINSKGEVVPVHNRVPRHEDLSLD
jgi:hypothetical protein